MKIFLLKRSHVKVVAIGMLLLILFSIFGVLNYYKSDQGVIAEPIYQGDSATSQVAITVNVDWGEDVIADMLRIFKEKEVKATFYITGRFAEKFPELVKEIFQEGHEIGNHGYQHPHPDQISLEKNIEEIMKTETILEEIIGLKPTLFAPPYGEHGAQCLAAAESCGYKTILWTADTIDWQQPAPSKETLVQRVTGEKLVNGAIILMHPKVHTIEALPVMIDTIKEKGFTLVTVSQLL